MCVCENYQNFFNVWLQYTLEFKIKKKEPYLKNLKVAHNANKVAIIISLRRCKHFWKQLKQYRVCVCNIRYCYRYFTILNSDTERILFLITILFAFYDFVREFPSKLIEYLKISFLPQLHSLITYLYPFIKSDKFCYKTLNDISNFPLVICFSYINMQFILTYWYGEIGIVKICWELEVIF